MFYYNLDFWFCEFVYTAENNGQQNLSIHIGLTLQLKVLANVKGPHCFCVFLEGFLNEKENEEKNLFSILSEHFNFAPTIKVILQNYTFRPFNSKPSCKRKLTLHCNYYYTLHRLFSIRIRSQKKAIFLMNFFLQFLNETEIRFQTRS